jgi:hypothetical protein
MKNQNTYSNKTKEDLNIKSLLLSAAYVFRGEAASTISLKIGLTASLIKPAIYHTEGEYTCHWSPRPYPLFLKGKTDTTNI